MSQILGEWLEGTSQKLHAPSLPLKESHPWLDNVALGAPYGHSSSDTGRMSLNNGPDIAHDLQVLDEVLGK